ncbi:MAG: hypothetical protein SH820_15215 [Xanthomonadales bacterium]|nr:hypothetical protein [Xanthomonadales bacterium]
MPDPRDAQLQEVTILTRAVENVFRKLIRFLVGRISLVKLQEMISYIYVQESENLLREEFSGKNIPLTKLALLTGLDTRAITSMRETIEESSGEFQQILLKDLTPESAIVEAWAAKIKKTSDPENDELRTLKFGGEEEEFEKLVRSTITTRGLTIQSLIQTLLATNSISIDKKRKKLKLLVDHYSPYLSNDEPNMVNAAFSAVSNLISTIQYNVTASVDERMFQRQVWTFRLPPAKLLAFRKSMRDLLKGMEQESKDQVEGWEAESFDADLLSAGIGFYYFEDRV